MILAALLHTCCIRHGDPSLKHQSLLAKDSALVFQSKENLHFDDQSKQGVKLVVKQASPTVAESIIQCYCSIHSFKLFYIYLLFCKNKTHTRWHTVKLAEKEVTCTISESMIQFSTTNV